MNIAQLIVALKKFPMDLEVKVPRRTLLGHVKYIPIETAELIKKYEFDLPNTKAYIALKPIP
jgi:hypothetical protein